MSKVKKQVKVITIDVEKCNGCRACEAICAAFHAQPKYSSVNPSRSRIRMVRYPLKDVYLPVYAGKYVSSECMGRNKYMIAGKEYDECELCRCSCPSRDAFKEPDSGLPFQCDMCEENEPGQEPLCVQWCKADALTYEVREEEVEVEEEEKLDELDNGLKSLADKFGLNKLVDSILRLSEKG